MSSYTNLPHETLEAKFEEAFSKSDELKEADKRLSDAYDDFDLDGSSENASKILNALTMIEVEKAKIRYALVNESLLSQASIFANQVRHT